MRRAIIAVIIALAFYVGWRTLSFNQNQFYVVVSSARAAAFPGDILSVAASSGLRGQAGKATDDRGNTLHAIEATSFTMRMWAQNMPLSGHEDPIRCGKLEEPHPDPRQFIVIVESKLPFSASRSQAMADAITTGLASKGYSVRKSPAVCG